MSGSADAATRRRTRYRGISYRVKADGSRTYYVHAQGCQHKVEGGEKEALALQATLRTRLARGERVASSTTTFSAIAEDWFASKSKLAKLSLIHI